MAATILFAPIVLAELSKSLLIGETIINTAFEHGDRGGYNVAYVTSHGAVLYGSQGGKHPGPCKRLEANGGQYLGEDLIKIISVHKFTKNHYGELQKELERYIADMREVLELLGRPSSRDTWDDREVALATERAAYEKAKLAHAEERVRIEADYERRIRLLHAREEKLVTYDKLRCIAADLHEAIALGEVDVHAALESLRRVDLAPMTKLDL